jgi:dTDP-4-dehydrorhamnose 3,5-epimerase
MNALQKSAGAKLIMQDAMIANEMALPGVMLITLKLFKDQRGFFFESYNKRALEPFLGDVDFVQDNCSHSSADVLRGLHFQLHHPQGKLVRVVAGAIFDVVVDLRCHSPTFKRWIGVPLSAMEPQLLWIPPGCAHGFLTLSPSADLLYKATDYYSPADERCLRWDDPDLAIDWPLQRLPILSDKDRQGNSLKDLEAEL